MNSKDFLASLSFIVKKKSARKFLSLCVSRKAIAKSGLHHLPSQPSTSSLSRTDPEAGICSTVEWTVSLGIGVMNAKVTREPFCNNEAGL